MGAFARAALRGMLGTNLHQLFLQYLDPFSKQATVGFQLGFARAAHADTAALTLQVRPSANKAGRKMLELRQFDLQFADVTARALGKNIKDQAGAINHPAIQLSLQIAFLDRAKGMVEQNQRGFVIRYGLGNLIDLALAGKQRSVGSLTTAAYYSCNGNTAAACQQLQFFHAFGVIRHTEVQGHHNSPGAATRTLKHQKLLIKTITYLASHPFAS